MGKFDFGDAIHDLFESKQAITKQSVDHLKGRRVCVNYFKLIHILLKPPNTLNFPSKIEMLDEYFASNDIQIEVVDKGLDDFAPEDTIGIYHQLNWLRNRFYYFKMIFSFQSKIIPEDEKLFKENEGIGNFSYTDAFARYSFRMIYGSNIQVILERSSFDLRRAPQMIESQLLYTLKNSEDVAVWTSPLIFLISDLTKVISHIDIENEVCEEYDLTILAREFDCDPKMLRKCLFGALMFFVCDPSIKNKTKFIEAFSENPSEFATTYMLKRNNHRELLMEKIYILLKVFKSPGIEADFCDQVSQAFNLDVSEVQAQASFYLNNIVLDNNNALISYPGNKFLTSKKYLLDLQSRELVTFFSRMMFEEEILMLLNKCTNNKVTLNFPKFDFVEFHYVNKVYYKGFLESSISNYLQLLGDFQSPPMSYKFFEEEPIMLQVKNTHLDFRIPKFNMSGEVTIFNSLFRFYQATTQHEQFYSVEEIPNATEADVFFYIYLVFLHELKFIDLTKPAILIPAASLASTNPGELTEELIFVFEILRHNLLMADITIDGESILRDFEKFMANNVFDDAFYQKNSISAIFFKPFVDNKSESISLSSDLDYLQHSFQVSFTQTESTLNLLTQKPEILKTSLIRSSTTFYSRIKNFQKEYKAFYGFDNALMADVILNRCFEDSVMRTLLIASRIFSFVETDLLIENSYSLDSFQFQQIINTVQKSMIMFLNSVKINCLTKLQVGFDLDDFPIIRRQLAFDKHYSVDNGKLAIIMLTDYLFYQTLMEENDPFASEHKKLIAVEKLRESLQIKFDVLDFLRRGKSLNDKLQAMIQTIQKMAQVDLYDETAKCLVEISRLLEKAIDFYQEGPNF